MYGTVHQTSNYHLSLVTVDEALRVTHGVAMVQTLRHPPTEQDWARHGGSDNSHDVAVVFYCTVI